jgi:hypothetical protein
MVADDAAVACGAGRDAALRIKRVVGARVADACRILLITYSSSTVGIKAVWPTSLSIKVSTDKVSAVKVYVTQIRVMKDGKTKIRMP